jgi:hypothetical protein
VGKEEAERWGPLAVGMGKASELPENAARSPLNCKMQHLLRLLLEPLQCVFGLHFADADAFTTTPADNLKEWPYRSESIVLKNGNLGLKASS